MSAACNNTLPNDNTDLCTLSTCCMAQAIVGYRPSVPTNAAYLSIFALFLLTQLASVKIERGGF